MNCLSPSILSADFANLGEQVQMLDQAGAGYVHIDVMDGSFVPNYTLGTDFVKAIKSKTDIPLDIHLMIDNPENKLDWFEFGENDYVSVHYEATKHLHKAVAEIKKRNAKAMVAINPATPISVLENVLDDIDAVLVMTVNPGFAGQKLVKSTLKKIRKLRDYLDNNGCGHIEIEVDGNVSFENAELMNNAGADIFVAGTSSIFSKDGNMFDNTFRLRKILS